jgi:hypothetical protein
MSGRHAIGPLIHEIEWNGHDLWVTTRRDGEAVSGQPLSMAEAELRTLGPRTAPGRHARRAEVRASRLGQLGVWLARPGTFDQRSKRRAVRTWPAALAAVLPTERLEPWGWVRLGLFLDTPRWALLWRCRSCRAITERPASHACRSLVD